MNSRSSRFPADDRPLRLRLPPATASQLQAATGKDIISYSVVYVPTSPSNQLANHPQRRRDVAAMLRAKGPQRKKDWLWMERNGTLLTR